MMKLTLLRNSLLVSALVVMASCGGDEEEQVGPVADLDFSDPASVIEELKISRIIDDGEEYDFTYGSDGRLEKVVSSESETSGGWTFESDSETLLTYSNGKLTSVVEETVNTETAEGGETRTDSRTRTVSYIYNANELVSEIGRVYSYKNEDGSTGEDSWSSSLEYNADNKIEREIAADPEEDYEEWRANEWSGENVVKQSYYYDDNPGGRIENRLRKRRSSLLRRQGGKEAVLEEQYVFSDFDDRLNPLAIFSVLDGDYFGQFISTNNPRKMVDYEVNEGGNMTANGETTIDIEYDSNGRPIKYTMMAIYAGQENVEEITIEYMD